jgi:hypothetical protein
MLVFNMESEATEGVNEEEYKEEESESGEGGPDFGRVVGLGNALYDYED